MVVVVGGLLLVVAVFLIVSATAKGVHPNAAATALVELGLQRALARVAVVVGVVLETCVAGAIVLWPRALEARLACAGLFTVFALVGGVALITDRRVECGCFGSLHRSRLGLPQILQLAAVVPVMFLLGGNGPLWTPQTGLAVLLGVVAASSAVLLAHAGPTWWRIRRDQRSLAGAKEYVRRAHSAHVAALEAGTEPA